MQQKGIAETQLHITVNTVYQASLESSSSVAENGLPVMLYCGKYSSNCFWLELWHYFLCNVGKKILKFHQVRYSFLSCRETSIDVYCKASKLGRQ